MHELSITQNIVAIASEYARGFPVRRVTLEIGCLAAVLPDSIRFCFDVCCQGTVLEGSTLEIREIPGLGKCRQCGAEFSLDQPWGICARCDSSDLEISQGTELRIKELEVEERCA